MSRVPALLLSPLVLPQARRLRQEIPRLPDAGGSHATGSELVVLGDSTAVGVGVDSLDDAISGQLSRSLGFGTTVLGESGLTSAEVRERYLPDALDVPADLVVLLVGWNDAMRLRPAGAVARDVVDMARRLQAARLGRRVIVVEAPRFENVARMPQPLRAALGSSAAGIRRAVRRELATWGIDTAPGFDGRSVASDGFHPDAEGYRAMAENVVAAVRNTR